MPKGNTSTPNAAIGGLSPHPISNPKTATMTPAKNGFVIQMQKTTEYGQDYAIATTPEEVTKIISDYFAA